MIWRLAREVLPTRGRVRQNTTKVSGDCGIGGNEKETDWYLSMDCRWTRSLWEEAGFANMVSTESKKHHEFKDLFWGPRRNSMLKIENVGVHV